MKETFEKKWRLVRVVKNSKTMAQELRIESPDSHKLITSRTVQSRLWFINNKSLEDEVLGYLAKYQEKYSVILHAFIFQGNHYHLLASYPKCNRAQFMRDFNARFAECTKRHVSEFGEGALFAT